jgi:hypothetical protein
MSIYKCPSIDTTTREYMQELFSEFLTSDATGQALPSMPNSVSLQSPLIPETASQDQPLSESGGTLEVSKPSYEGQYISEEEDGEVGDHPQQHLEDDDVDLYLYGEAEKNAGNGDATDTTISGDGDVVMADIDDDNEEEVEESRPASIRGGTPSAVSLGGGHVTDPETPGSISEGAPMTPHVDTQSEMSEDDALIEDDELEEEDEMEVEEQGDGAGSGLQANQSYWIFGDSLKKFKTACIAVKNTRMENDTEYETQLGNAKRSLKDILAVYIRIVGFFLKKRRRRRRRRRRKRRC